MPRLILSPMLVVFGLGPFQRQAHINPHRPLPASQAGSQQQRCKQHCQEASTAGLTRPSL